MGKEFPLAVVVKGLDRLTGPLGKMSRTLSRWGKKTRAIGRSMTLGLTLPLVGLGTVVTDKAVNFDRSMNRIQAVTLQTAEAMKPLREQAKLLGAETIYTAGQVAEGMTFLGQAGLDTNQIFKAIGPTVKLASAANMEMGETADRLTDIMKGYGKTLEDIPALANLIALAQASATQTGIDFAEAMKMAGPSAAAFGIEIEQTAGLLSALADAGLKGTMGGTALRRVLTDLTKKGYRFGGTLLPILEALHKLPTEEIFGKMDVRGATAVAALATSGGVQNVQRIIDKFKENTTALETMNRIMMQGSPGAMARLAASFEAFALKVAESGLLDVITDLVDDLVELLRYIANADKESVAWGIKLAAVAAALGPVIAAVGSLFGAIAALVAFVKVAVIPALVAFGTVSAPVAAAIAILGLVAMEVIDNWELVKKWFGSFLDWLTKAFHDAVDWILGAIDTVSDWLPDWITKGTTLQAGYRAPKGALEPAPVRLYNRAFSGAVQAVSGTRHEEVRTERQELKIDFRGVPRGTRITAPSGAAAPEINVGWSMDDGGGF